MQFQLDRPKRMNIPRHLRALPGAWSESVPFGFSDKSAADRSLNSGSPPSPQMTIAWSYISLFFSTSETVIQSEHSTTEAVSSTVLSKLAALSTDTSCTTDSSEECATHKAMLRCQYLYSSLSGLMISHRINKPWHRYVHCKRKT